MNLSEQSKILKPKLGLLELGKQLGNVSQACKMLGYSRGSFYKFKELYEKRRENHYKKLVLKPDIIVELGLRCLIFQGIFSFQERFLWSRTVSLVGSSTASSLLITVIGRITPPNIYIS